MLVDTGYPSMGLDSPRASVERMAQFNARLVSRLSDRAFVLVLWLAAVALSLLSGVAMGSQDGGHGDLLAGLAVASREEGYSIVAFTALSSLAVLVLVVVLDVFSLRRDVAARRWIVTGYAIRVLYALCTRFFYVLDDEPRYIQYVRQFIRGRSLSAEALQYGHGYTLVLAPFLALWGDHIIIGRLLNCLVGALVLVLVYKSALAIFGRREVARAALILAAIYPVLIVFSGSQVRDIWLALYAIGLIWAVVSERSPWAVRLLVFAGSGAAFYVSRPPQGLAFVGVCVAYLLWVALARRKLGLALLVGLALLLVLQFILIPRYENEWRAEWERQYLSLEGTGSEGKEGFSGISRQLVYGQRNAVLKSVLTFGRVVFTPLPTHFLSSWSFAALLESLAGLLWYLALPFVGLGIWYRRRNRATWLLLGIYLANTIMLTPARLAFGYAMARGRVAALPAVFTLAAAGYAGYRELGPDQRRSAFRWLLLCGLAELGLVGVYTLLAL